MCHVVGRSTVVFGCFPTGYGNFKQETLITGTGSQSEGRHWCVLFVSCRLCDLQCMAALNAFQYVTRWMVSLLSCLETFWHWWHTICLYSWRWTVYLYLSRGICQHHTAICHVMIYVCQSWSTAWQVHVFHFPNMYLPLTLYHLGVERESLT